MTTIPTTVILENLSGQEVILEEDTICGLVSDEDLIETAPAADVINTIIDANHYGFHQMDTCFCDTPKDIIGILHHQGFSHYTEENLLTVHGALLTKESIFYEPSTRRLLISDNFTKSQTSKYISVLRNIPADTIISISVPSVSVSLKQHAVLQALLLLAVRAKRQIRLCFFDCSQCEKHSSWKVELAPEVLFIFKYAAYTANDQTTKTINKRDSHFSFMNHQINMKLATNSTSVLIEVDINAVKQLHPGYLSMLCKHILKQYLSACFYKPIFGYCTPNNETYLSLQNILTQLGDNEIHVSKAWFILEQFGLNPTDFLLTDQGKSSKIESLNNVGSSNPSDSYNLLESVQEILLGGGDPFGVSMEDLPEMETPRMIKLQQYNLTPEQTALEINKLAGEQAAINSWKVFCLMNALTTTRKFPTCQKPLIWPLWCLMQQPRKEMMKPQTLTGPKFILFHLSSLVLKSPFTQLCSMSLMTFYHSTLTITAPSASTRWMLTLELLNPCILRALRSLLKSGKASWT